MYCKIIKLTNGEDLIADTADDCSNLHKQNYIEVTDPVAIETVKMPFNGMLIETYVMRPWIKLSKDNVLQIPVTSILVATDVIEKAEEQYRDFIVKYNNFEEQVDGFDDLDDESMPSDDDVLNNYFEMLEEIEDDENDSRPSSRSKTYH